MIKLDELLEQEEKLEKQREEWLEADNNRMAKKIEKELYKVKDKMEVIILEEKILLKDEIEIYKKYVEKRGLEKDFKMFYDKEQNKGLWE